MRLKNFLFTEESERKLDKIKKRLNLKTEAKAIRQLIDMMYEKMF